MVTLLDCIERVPNVLEEIIKNRRKMFSSFINGISSDINIYNEIILVGSGTSNTSAITARYFCERASGLRTTVVLPNEYLYDLTVHNPNAIYLFISQTGSSTVVMDCLVHARERGYLTAALSERTDTLTAKAAEYAISIGCGHEEHPTRTIGYSASVLDIMLLGMEIGMARGFLSQSKYDEYIAQAEKLPDSIRKITASALEWMKTSKRTMLRSSAIIFTGSGALYGVAQEASVKVWELPQIPSFGYELEEGIHGPNFGYNYSHCIIALNDGGRENDKAQNLIRYMKNEWKTGFIIGEGALDDSDFAFTPVSGAFSALEFAPVVQVLSNVLAVDGGRNMTLPHDNSVMYSYFNGHSEVI
jgi:Glucosamine 6-phosphate synthetase, contains amidotransferase and phosphosugar isomerase domains